MAFLVLSSIHFVNLAGGVNKLSIDEVPKYSLNFGFVLGILSYSYS
jgi:hypothetical protein